MSQENVDLVKSFFAGFSARDGEAVDRLMARDAEITTVTARAGLPGRWVPGATRQYFEQLDETLADFRIEIEDYRDLGARVVALGTLRGAGMSSHIEVASEFAVVFIVSNSRIRVVDSYDNWNAALESVGPAGPYDG
jgi:ketosteroid isomerase-like protein